MKRLTRKQAKIARLAIKNPEATQQEIGDKIGMRQPHVARELAKPHVKNRIRELMDLDPRLKDKALVKKIGDKMEAKTVKVFCTKQGDIVYSDELEAHDIQIRAAELAVKLKGQLKESVEVTGKDGEPLVPPTPPIDFSNWTEKQIDAFIAATAAATAAKAIKT